ncbi:MAG: penicillin-binding protein, partial [Clostridia bacterium]|nr:penicillin-binding protein [Clostridia bacterium]
MRKTDISHFGSSGYLGDNPKIKSQSSVLHKVKIISKILARLGLSVLAVVLMTSIMVVCSLAAYRSSLLKNDIALNINASKMALTSFVYVNDENGNPQEYQRVYNLENRVWVDFQNIPQHMKDAAIAIEDKRFYEHKGVDWIRTSGAAMNLLGGSQSYGGSTLTQQLIKNITEDNQVSLARKMREIFRATQLEEMYSKDEILESYLNVVNFGSGCRGVQAAANVYFGKNIQDCSLVECATIAGITQNPAAYNPIYHPENNRERRETVLGEMLDQKKISNEEFNEAMEISANMDFSEAEERAEKEISSAAVRNWYVETLLRDVVNDLCVKYHIGKSAAEDMLYTQGLKIYSAMDTKAQDIVENTLKDSSVMSKDKNLQLGYVMMGFDGRILATVGSRNEKKGNLLYDRANVGRRQPGSTIKPLAAYAPAIDWGIYNYSSLIPDEPLKIDSDG